MLQFHMSRLNKVAQQPVQLVTHQEQPQMHHAACLVYIHRSQDGVPQHITQAVQSLCCTIAHLAEMLNVVMTAVLLSPNIQ